MAPHALWQDVANWPLSQYIASSSWAFPTFESIHVIAICTVVGSIVVMDLRLLGLASGAWTVNEVSRDTLRWTWGAFLLALVTGSLLFISKATDYSANPYFVSKLALIVLAGANMAVFHLVTWRKVGDWDSSPAIPLEARIAGGVSLGLWIVVVLLARAVGFTLDKFGS